MARLGTEGLRALITGWMAPAGDNLDDFYDDITGAELDALKRAFTDGSGWKRESKVTLRAEWRGTVDLIDRDKMLQWIRDAIEDFCFATELDMLQAVDRDLLATVPNGDLDRCILRVFTPRDDRLADNWRLEVITTPDDSGVIAHALIVD